MVVFSVAAIFPFMCSCSLCFSFLTINDSFVFGFFKTPLFLFWCTELAIMVMVVVGVSEAWQSREETGDHTQKTNKLVDFTKTTMLKTQESLGRWCIWPGIFFIQIRLRMHTNKLHLHYLLVSDFQNSSWLSSTLNCYSPFDAWSMLPRPALSTEVWYMLVYSFVVRLLCMYIHVYSLLSI